MFFKNIKAVLISNSIVQAIAFVSSFVTKRFIAPSLMGIWNLVTVVQSYILMLNVGVSSAASREIPYWVGKKDLETESKIRETMFFVIFLELFLASVVYYLVFFFNRGFFKEGIWYLYLLAPFYAVTTKIYNSFVIIFQARQEFVKLSKLNVQLSLATIALSLIGAIFFGITGFFVAFVILYSYRLGMAIKICRQIGLKVKAKFHWQVFKHLIKIGFPMEIGFYFFGIYATIDSLLVTRWLGVASLALYAIGANLAKQLGDFPTQMSTVTTNKIINTLGETQDFKSLSRDIFILFAGNYLVLMPFLALFGFFVAPWMIRLFVRNYLGAILPLQIIIFSIFISPHIHLPLTLFLIKRQLSKLVLFNIAILLILLGTILFFKIKGTGLTMVSLSVVVGYFIGFVIIFLDSTSGVFSAGEKFKVLLIQQFAIWFTVCLAFGLEIFLPASLNRKTDTIYTLIKMFIGTALCIPVAVYGLMITKTWNRVKEEFAAVMSNFKTAFSF